MIGTAVGDALEARVITLSSRQVNLGLPKKEPAIDAVVYPFKLGIDSKAYIEEELNPKTPKVDSGAYLNTGDGLHAETISGFSQKVLNRQLTQRTKGHKGTECKTKRYGYAKIDVGIRGLLQRKISQAPAGNSPAERP